MSAGNGEDAARDRRVGWRFRVELVDDRLEEVSIVKIDFERRFVATDTNENELDSIRGPRDQLARTLGQRLLIGSAAPECFVFDDRHVLLAAVSLKLQDARVFSSGNAIPEIDGDRFVFNNHC